MELTEERDQYKRRCEHLLVNPESNIRKKLKKVSKSKDISSLSSTNQKKSGLNNDQKVKKSK